MKVVASCMTALSGITGIKSIPCLTNGCAVFNIFFSHPRPCGHGARSYIAIEELRRTTLRLRKGTLEFDDAKQRQDAHKTIETRNP